VLVSGFTVEALEGSRLKRAGPCALAPAAGSGALVAVVSILTTVLVDGCEIASEGAPDDRLGEVEVRNAGWNKVSFVVSTCWTGNDVSRRINHD
jgi:hypothetical protein